MKPFVLLLPPRPGHFRPEDEPEAPRPEDVAYGTWVTLHTTVDQEPVNGMVNDLCLSAATSVIRTTKGYVPARVRPLVHTRWDPVHGVYQVSVSIPVILDPIQAARARVAGL